MKKVLLVLILVLLAGCSTQTVVVEPEQAENATPAETTTIEVTEEPGTVNGEKVAAEEETTEVNTTEMSEEQKSMIEALKEQQEEAAEQAETPDNIEKIKMKKLKFYPEDVTIKKGGTVVWDHEDTFNGRTDLKHMIKIHYIGVRSPQLFLGDTWNYTFNETGKYLYIDVLFPSKMKGEITVTE